MGMKRSDSAPVVEVQNIPSTVAPPENGTAAAVSRLKAIKPEPQAVVTSGYKQRDYDAEARGKTRCSTWNAAVMSPAIAGMQFKDVTEYLVFVRQVAEAGVSYTFGEDTAV